MCTYAEQDFLMLSITNLIIQDKLRAETAGQLSKEIKGVDFNIKKYWRNKKFKKNLWIRQNQNFYRQQTSQM